MYSLLGSFVLSPLSVASGSSSSLNCEPYDLRETMVGSERPLPIQREQGASGWCYAMVLSDLLSYQLQVTVSSADIALHHLNSHFSEHWQRYQSAAVGSEAQTFPFGGGRLSVALEDLKSRGVCLEQDFASHLQNKRENQAVTKSDRLPASADSDVTLKGLSRFFSDEHTSNVAHLLQSVKDPHFFFALNQIAAQPRCTPHQLNQIKQMNLKLQMDEKISSVDQDHFHQRLDNSLSRYKMLAIAYSPEVLKSTTAIKFNETGSHLSSIVGRRYNAKKTRCEYLIRNSEGSCQDYAQGYECKNNHVWVPRQKIQSATSHFMFLSKN